MMDYAETITAERVRRVITGYSKGKKKIEEEAAKLKAEIPNYEKLEKLAEYFRLTENEKSIMFDLAGAKKSEVAPDIPGYIKEHDYVVSALRTARDLGASEKDWLDFIEDLKQRKG